MPEVLIRTVSGHIRADSLTGPVLPSEHLRTDLRWGAGIDSDPYRWLDEEQGVSAELSDLAEHEDLSLVVDLTCIGMGRDAASLSRICAGSKVPTTPTSSPA